mgnify:CR=1 FL=1
MTSQKQYREQIEELEKDRMGWGIAFLVTLIVAIFIIVSISIDRDNLQSQLSNCESEQETWILKVECQTSFLEGKVTEKNILTYTFDDFEDYRGYREVTEKNENCEVIE